MTNAPSFPPLLERGVAILIFALGIYMVAVHAILIALAAQRSTIRQGTRVLAPLLVGAFLAAWLGVGVATGDGTNFPLATNEFRRPLSLAVGFGPMTLAIGLLFVSQTMRAVNAATPPEWLIRVQTYRIAGLMFLFPFLYYGVIPAGFAIPAAAGDFLTGAVAPWVASQVARRRTGAFALATAWNLFGITDLIVAPVAAVLSHAQVLSVYPLALVPLFIGPPLGILTHIYSLRNLAVVSHADPPRRIGEVVRAV